MGKTANKKGAELSNGTPKALATPEAAIAAAPTSYQQSLDLDPVKKADEEKKAEKRLKKAKEAQEQQLRTNQWRAQIEKAWKKEQIGKAIVIKKWDKEVEQHRARAMAEGVLEAVDYGDGGWWVNVGKDTWKEIGQQYLCTLCDKQLNDCTLGAHIDSQAHKNKVAWEQPGFSAAASAPAPKAKDKTCACGLDRAACGACGRGWA
eukprot:CAMPEP_0204144614 /NCGR_PEP_ID=MMETSP0361-20130328/21143_1 /ASSEMBLY_ACC=CAM_ASM_000343 /TAXON_ID=268821 /ORGANISM="Scrippsiella Hangoei, Strain SHTV-5" /LENGTH=204 /DNA_ID=CAMNT_0051098563 /DNA_START=49 /DNA_END=659 /DNA_ORIENTATION=+